MQTFTKIISVLFCALMLTACCSSVKFRVIDADTGKPIENAMVSTSVAMPLFWLYSYVDTTNEKGEIFVTAKPRLTMIAKEGYWVAPSYPYKYDETTQSYTIKMHNLEKQFPYRESIWNPNIDERLGEMGYSGVLTVHFGLIKRKWLYRNKKIDDPDWERLRQICISANNQYKYLENQKKQNATKK